MKYLSNHIGNMMTTYDVVIIGSGYGGGISASRLSRAGKKVCVLERGKEYQAGDFPDNLITATKEMQTHSAHGHEGSPTALFDLHIHKGISVLVGCGLGGTSLINANVSIKPEERVFDDPFWPIELRNEFDDPGSLLNRGYELARKMLGASPLPDNIQLNKLKGLEKSANANGEKFYRTDINVNFDVNGENHVGVEQTPCNLCGDCCSGCNYTSKNTIVMNYLPDAKAHGADIFTETSVSHIEKKGDKWLIHFSHVGTGEGLFHAASSFVEADTVVLSAGTLGSTEILLRSKEKGLNVSDKVGQHFSGNGDVLGFAYNTREVIDGVGKGRHKTKKGHDAGPCITGIIDHRYQDKLDDGMIIEDAAIPGALHSLMPLVIDVENKLIGVRERQEDDKGFINRLKHEYQTLLSDICGSYSGAIQNTQTYLVMSHDGEHGVIEFKDDKLNINWTRVGQEEIFKKIDLQLRKETLGLSGVYVKNPIWVKAMNEELISVHPLGGCYMGTSINEAVLNHKGQVFSSDEPSGVYENFYVTDGSVIPRSLGVNPLLTISAISERCCAIMAKDKGWTIDYDSTKKLNLGKIPEKKVGVEFTETMRGFFTKGISNDDYKKGFDEGESVNNALQFTLVIRSEDVYEMIKSPAHKAGISGTVTAPGLSLKPMEVSNGVFNLFVNDPTNVNTKLMNYSMRLDSEEGKTYYFKGFKFVRHEKGLDEWSDTSTLYITIFDGPDDTGAIVGQGILHILMADFAKQMRTMKAVNASSKIEGIKALAAFSGYFMRSLDEVYGGIFAPITYHDSRTAPRKKRKLRLCDPAYHPVKTADGLQLLLTRYNGGTKGPLMMVHGFSGNRRTFCIDTIDTNAAEYFYEQGYDVWLFDYRLSDLLPSAKTQQTLDAVAKYDYPAAIGEIQQLTGAKQIDILAHCVGSITLFMAMLNGLQGVRSIVSAQIASDFYPAAQVKWKAALYVPQILKLFGVKTLTAYADIKESWLQKLYDRVVATYAVWVAGNCTDASCHRMTFMFAPLINHEQLNRATHRATIEMFGTANIRTYEQLTAMIRKHKLIDAKGKDTYMSNMKNLALPITFIHGEENQLFKPKSTLTTYETLCNTNGANLYKRHVVPAYGHNDCMYGKNADKDIFPLVLEHFNQFNS